MVASLPASPGAIQRSVSQPPTVTWLVAPNSTTPTPTSTSPRLQISALAPWRCGKAPDWLQRDPWRLKGSLGGCDVVKLMKARRGGPIGRLEFVERRVCGRVDDAESID